jgi:hypothetical protein
LTHGHSRSERALTLRSRLGAWVYLVVRPHAFGAVPSLSTCVLGSLVSPCALATSSSVASFTSSRYFIAAAAAAAGRHRGSCDCVPAGFRV